MYSLRVKINSNLTSAKLVSDDGEVIKSRSWGDLGIPNTEEEMGGIFREVVKRLFPRRYSRNRRSININEINH